MNLTEAATQQPLCKNIHDLLERVKPPDMYAELVNSYNQNTKLIPNRYRLVLKSNRL